MIRTITASGIVASVIAGNRRCSQPSRVNSPVLQVPHCTTCPRPKLGNQPSHTANTRISNMPIRKVGSDTPSKDKVMNTRVMT